MVTRSNTWTCDNLFQPNSRFFSHTIDEFRYTVVFLHTQSMRFVAPSCFFIQNRCKPLHCQFFNKKSTNIVARSCVFHYNRVLFNRIDEIRCTVALSHARSIKTVVLSGVFLKQLIKIVVLSCFCTKNNEHRCTVILFSNKIVENRGTIAIFHTRSMTFVVLSCFFIQNR